MTALLDHLGLTLLGFIEYGANRIPPAHRTTWKTYARNKSLAPDLFHRVVLRDFLATAELRVPDDFLGDATLVALGYIFGHVDFAQARKFLDTPALLEKLLCSLRGRIRITRGARRYEDSQISPSFPKK